MADLFSSPWTWLVVGYLLGSIPWGLVLTWLAGKGDVRAVGSGNIGTTNVLRAGGKWLAALTLLFDAGKGALAVWLGGEFALGGAVLGGMGAFIGHCFPIFLAFRGGKGVATFLGIALALDPLAGLVFVLVWIGAVLATRYSSLGGLTATFAATVIPFLHGAWSEGLLLAGMTAMVVAKHEDNIRRLLSGTESRIGEKSGAAAPGDEPPPMETGQRG